jgi:predicted DNA-binding protein with PD1-like motif
VFTYPSDDGRAAFVRLPRGVDLLDSLNEAAATLEIEAGTLQIVGAVEELTVAY